MLKGRLLSKFDSKEYSENETGHPGSTRFLNLFPLQGMPSTEMAHSGKEFQPKVMNGSGGSRGRS